MFQSWTVFIALFIALLGWAWASPVGSSPDEDFHVISSWCAGDGADGLCEAGAKAGSRDVNAGLVLVSCFAHKGAESASCQREAGLFERTELVETERGNFGGQSYPGGFYEIMHFFTGDDIQLSVLLMRAFNSLLFVTMFAAIWLLAPLHIRAGVFYTFTLIAVPLTVFLIASVNPSSWAITGTFSAFFAAVAALYSRQRRRGVLWVLAAFGAVLASVARWDGIIYSLFAFLAALAAFGTMRLSRKRLWIALSGIGVVAVASLSLGFWSILDRLFGLAGEAPSDTERSPMSVLAFNVANLPELWAGFSGAMGLGWLDTPMPKTVWMVCAVLLWATMFLQLSRVRRAQLWVSAATFALLVFVPLVTLQMSDSVVGENVQSRYLLPLLIVLAGTLLTSATEASPAFSLVQRWVLSVGVTIAFAFALFTNMVRYVTGLGDDASLQLNSVAADGWWWSFGPAPMTVLAVASAGFAAFVVVGARLTQVKYSSGTAGQRSEIVT